MSFTFTGTIAGLGNLASGINQAQEKTYKAIDRANQRTALGAQARQALEALRLPVLDAELSRRVTYPESIAAGRGPTTYDAASVAAREVRRLANELEQLLGLPALPKPARRGA